MIMLGVLSFSVQYVYEGEVLLDVANYIFGCQPKYVTMLGIGCFNTHATMIETGYFIFGVTILGSVCFVYCAAMIVYGRLSADVTIVARGD